VAPAQNFIYADVNGNIGYQCPGLIPIRVEGHTGQFPVPGNGSYDWVGWIPRDELPYVKNPEKGYIVTANNKLQPATYPYLILNDHDYEPHYRALRIIEMLEAMNNHTVYTQMRMQFNQITGLWADFLPLLQTIPTSSLDDVANSWLAALLKWDGNELTNSVEATVFEYWIYTLGEMASQETGYASWAVPYYLLNTLRNDADPSCGGSCADVMARALKQAVSMMGNKNAPSGPEWGSIHQLHIEHAVMSQTALGCAFNRVLPYGGDSYCVNVGAMSSKHKDDDPPYEMTVGPSYRQIVDLSNMENSQFIIPMGQSGNVLDKNYDSLLNDFMNDKYAPMKTSGYTVADKLTLKP
jgi:penicillin amidase